MHLFLNKLRRAFRGSGPPSEGWCPSVPEGHCVYAIGDIHGEHGCLMNMLEAIRDHHLQNRAEDDRMIVVFLGDYIDRGPNSRGVLETLCQLAESEASDGPDFHFLKGNHETAMLDFLTDPVGNAQWLSFGGAEALASYGVVSSVGVFDPKRCRNLRDDLEDRLPERHRAFLEHLRPMVVVGDYVFVHAGVRPGVPLDRQRESDFETIREPFLSSQRFHGKIVVHGHTPVETPMILPNRIAIDSGAYATGKLSAVALNGTSIDIITVSGVETPKSYHH